MYAELFEALNDIEKEKGIPVKYMTERITQALISAYKRDNAGFSDNIVVDIDETKKDIQMYVKKNVVEEVENPQLELSLEQAREKNPKAEIGDVVNIYVKTSNFGRIAAQTAKQVIIQGIREAERGIVYQMFTSKEQEILNGIVSKVDIKTGNLIIEVGATAEKTEVVLTRNEQVKNEVFKEGDRIRVYLVEVRQNQKGFSMLVSRTHPGLVKRLFELEVPEIFDGTVEIRSISREPGSRTKIAVWSKDENVDPIGACVGPKGSRVNNIVGELHGEKIDIISYSEEPARFVASALSPADTIDVILEPTGKSCRVIVPDDQLSLAIGKEGQNARLAAKLTGYKIDIKPESQQL